MDRRRSWGAPRKCARSAWTYRRWGIPPGPRRPTASVPAAGGAPGQVCRARVRWAPGAWRWQTARCPCRRGRREIVQPLAGRFVVDHRADGHLEVDRVAFGARAIAALAMPAALRLVLGVKTELDERVSMLGGNQENVAAAAAIAAAGASARNIFLAAKG